MDKCSARKRSGDPCGNPPVHGATVCRMHGGKAPQVQAKAAERLLTVAIGKDLAQRKIVPVTSPLATLQHTAGTALAWMDICQERLAQLPSLEYADAKLARDVVPLVTLFERSMDRALGVLGSMVKLGIEDRVARSAELTAEANLEAMRGMIRAARTTDASEEELLLGLLAGAVA